MDEEFSESYYGMIMTSLRRSDLPDSIGDNSRINASNMIHTIHLLQNETQ